ncbi:hypothetical protein Tco_1150730 [Tanacetum coccineum]
MMTHRRYTSWRKRENLPKLVERNVDTMIRTKRSPKPRHFKQECRALKKKQDRGNDNKNKDNNFVSMISEAFSLEEEKSWWVDSGATRHVCKDQTMFKTYEPSYSMLYIGNHSTAQVKGKGKIDLVFSFGNILTLNDVLHVPDVHNLSSNLINSSSPKVESSLAKAITPVECPKCE